MANTKDTRELQLNALLAQYSSLRTEINSVLREVQELSLYALVSMAGMATLVITLIDSAPHLLASVLLVLPLPFLAMLITYVGHLIAISNITQYIAENLEPRIAELVYGNDRKQEYLKESFGWDRFLYHKMKGPIRWLHQGFWAAGHGLLIVMPVLGSLAAFHFTRILSNLSLLIWWRILLFVDIGLLIIVVFATLMSISHIGLIRRRQKAQ